MCQDLKASVRYVQRKQVNRLLTWGRHTLGYKYYEESCTMELQCLERSVREGWRWMLHKLVRKSNAGGWGAEVVVSGAATQQVVKFCYVDVAVKDSTDAAGAWTKVLAALRDVEGDGHVCSSENGEVWEALLCYEFGGALRLVITRDGKEDWCADVTCLRLKEEK